MTTDIAGARLIAVWNDRWPEDIQAAVRELADIGVEWDQAKARREQLTDRRKELYLLLDGVVPHRVIAEIAGSTKGAVEPVVDPEP